MAERARLRRVLFLVVGLALTGAVLGAYAGGVLRQLEDDAVDARFAVRGAQPAPRNVAVVEVDDVTFDELDEQWPFPRSMHGRAIDRISADGPSAIAYDVQFTEPTEESEDNALIDAVSRAGNVILAASEVDPQGGTNVFGGGSVLSDVGARAGNTTLPPDQGGVLRRLPFATDGLTSFAVAAAEVARGRPVPERSFPAEGALIDYRGRAGSLRSVSFSDVHDGKVPRGFFRDKLVVVGASAATLQDNHPTPMARDELMGGPEIEANAAWTVLAGLPLRDVPGWLDVALIVLMGMACPLLGLRLRPGWLIAAAVGLGALYALAAQLAFGEGLIVVFTYPLVALSLGAVGALGMHYMTAAFERQRTREIFSRFVPEKVVEEVLDRADGLRLGGERRECTVMFTDLRGFTTFSEKNDPDRVIEVLNRYLAEMSEAIMDQGGTLTAYLGDGIMALFGAPIPEEDHADRALAAARDMVGPRLERFNEWLLAEGFPEEFKMGVGLNTGPVMVGNVGSEKRLEYTALGDTCNTSSRLESMTKGSGHSVFLAEATREALVRPHEAVLVYVDELAVRGRENAVKVWSLGVPGQTPTDGDARHRDASAARERHWELDPTL